MKKLFAPLLVLSLLLLSACGTAEDDTVVSSEAKAVIEAAMTAPNEDLLFDQAYTLSSSSTQVEQEAAQQETARVQRNWEKAVGKYFSTGAVSKVLEQRWLNAFQLRSRDFNKKFAVAKLTLVFRDEAQETVDVVYTADGKEHRIRVCLEKAADGKFTAISYTLVEGSDSVSNMLLQLLGGLEEPDEVGQLDQATLDIIAARQRLLVENEKLWIAYSIDSTGIGSSNAKQLTIVLEIYSQDNELLQKLTYTAQFGADITLLDIIRAPESYLFLEDADGDGKDDLQVLVDGLQKSPQYRTFHWDDSLGLFVEG